MQFLKWLTATLTYGVLISVGEIKLGAISYLIQNDASHLVWVIIALTLSGIAWCGIKASKGATTYPRVDYLAELATNIGLLGTLVGLVILFSAGIGDSSDVLIGLSTAMTTTMAGLVAAIILSSYTVMLKQ